jgi:TRAP-type C4-dicarboxylate transport system permease small subunit
MKKKLRALDWFLVIMFSISVFSVVLQVFFRYFLHNSLIWSNEVCRFSFLWVVFIGTAVVLQDGDHIVIDVLLTALPPKPRNITALFGYALIAVFTAAITVMGIRLVISTNGSLSSALRLPINLLLYLSLPLGMGLSFFVSLGKIYYYARLLLGKEPSLAAGKDGPL